MNSRISLSLMILLLVIPVLAGCSGGGETRDEGSASSMQSKATAASRNDSGAAGFSKEDVAPMGLDLRWNYRHSGPIHQSYVANGNIYIVSSTRDYPQVLVKIDGESGLPRWTYPLEERLEHAPSVYVYPEELRSSQPDELFIVQRGRVHCVDDQYGARNYVVKCDFPISTGVSPGMENLIIGGFDMRAYGISKKDRFVNWTFLTGGGVTADAANYLNASYVGSEDGTVYKLLQGAGFVKSDCWDYRTYGAIEASPTVSGDRIYVGSRDTKVHCFSDAGEEAFLHWSTPTGKPVVSSPVVSGSSVFAVLTDDRYRVPVSEVVCLDSADGKEKWRLGGYDRILFSGSDSVSLLNSAGLLVNCSASDGRERWSLDTSACDSVEAIGQGMLLVYGDGLLQRIQIRR
ncbi:MAG: PQQ-binding-like beta-propeller repeat protein [Planctomycetota bacterium]